MKKDNDSIKKVKPAKYDTDLNGNLKPAYPPEWQQEIYDGFLTLLAPYKIIETDTLYFSIGTFKEKASTFYIISERGKEGFRDTKKAEKYPIKKVNPFEIEAEILLTDIYKLELGSHDSIIAFCNKYGLLNDGRIGSTPGLQKLDEFVGEARRIKLCMDMWSDIKNSVQKTLTKEMIDNIAEEYYDAYCCPTRHDYQSLIRTLLEMTISRHLSGIRPRLKMGKNGHFIKTITAEDLLSVIYYRLAEKIALDTHFKTCLYCGSKFVPSRSSQRFCPKEVFESRSRCENNFNGIRTRSREKVFLRGKTPEEVAYKMKNWPLGEEKGIEWKVAHIREWIKDYQPNS